MQNNFSSGRYDRLVIHTPHAGTYLPLQLNSNYYPQAQIANQKKRSFIQPYFNQLTDHYTDKLFGSLDPSIRQVSFPYSRLFCDVERLENDPLEQKGLGILYDFTKIIKCDCTRSNLWWRNDEYAMQLYKEHHFRLWDAILRRLIHENLTLILDCHSFSEQDNILCPNAHEYKGIDICLGYNEDRSKPEKITIDTIYDFFVSKGYNVALNKPFSNAKSVYYAAHSLMIEVNKHCYMNEDTLEITAGYYKLHAELQILYKLLLNS